MNTNKRPPRDEIELYEWTEDDPHSYLSLLRDRRPVTTLNCPPFGPPTIGEIVCVGGNMGTTFTFYKVVECVHLWSSIDDPADSDDDPFEKHTWLHTMIFARRIDGNDHHTV